MLKQIPKSLTLLACAISLLCGVPALAILEIPDSIIKTPLLVREESVSTFVPLRRTWSWFSSQSDLPDKTALQRRRSSGSGYPRRRRTGRLASPADTAQCGFIEVRFAFPGGGIKGLSSGGIYDYRGNESQEALRDILQFAAGRTTDTEGRHISDLVPIKVSSNNIGSLGGLTAAISRCTMGKYPDRLRFISWLAFYESPVGIMFFPQTWR